jgi:GDPmannose 4,6-dehydratase
MTRRALITGIAGQDGYYLTELLLAKGYEVVGFALPTDSLKLLSPVTADIRVVPGDLTDEQTLNALVQKVVPDEVYNLAAQSSVSVSWERPVLTAVVNGVAVLGLLEALRRYAPGARLLQPSSADMFGRVEQAPQDEETPFRPTSPYGAAKLLAHNLVRNYRDAYGTFGCNAILYNHESPLRPLDFVTRKITEGAARIKLGLADTLPLGALEARRDWGFAGDYVRAMWLMLQQDAPDDYVVASGETHSVGEFCEAAFSHLGLDCREHLTLDERFVRPVEPTLLQGDASKARTRLGWAPTVSFEELVGMMVDEDVRRLRERA